MKLKVTLDIGLIGCTREAVIEVEDEEIEGLDETDRNQFLYEAAEEWAIRYVNIGWEIKDTQGDAQYP